MIEWRFAAQPKKGKFTECANKVQIPVRLIKKQSFSKLIKSIIS